tara:strand:- start:180340 stop:180603 length:264 start_codon:yes stop_codon:yes gene_type:complete
VLKEQFGNKRLRMATENSGWGYLRIDGELKKFGHCVAKIAIATTLKDNGIAPSPDRPTSWKTFLKSDETSPPQPTSSPSTRGPSAGW